METYIHNYKLLDKLGKGAFSTVFKGEHRTTKKLVAIKVEKEATTLKHESKIIAYLNRELPGLPNIPTLYWYGLYGNNVCLATTYYAKSLNQYVEDDSFKLLKLCSKIISGLGVLHSAYIVHSDIKPDNIMIDANENPVFIDFGLSSLFYNAEKDIYKEDIRGVHLIGSPKYASYNLHLGHPVLPRDDLMSAGYLLMTILGIELPWSRELRSSGASSDAPYKAPLCLRPDGCIIPPYTSLQVPLAPYSRHEVPFRSESNYSENIIGEPIVPLFHVMHPENVQRAKYKKLEALKEYLLEKKYNQHLIPFFEKVYSLQYKEPIDYAGCRKFFSPI